MSSPNDFQLALRISADLLAAIDSEVERVRAERPGARVQRSDVVREALMRTFFKHLRAASGPIKREQVDPASARTNGDARDDDDDDERSPLDTQ